MKTALWAGIGAVALLWPARLAGPLDGAPLDQPIEAVVVGVLLVWLVATHRAVLHQPAARMLTIALLLWKVATGAFLVQDGWCLRFTSPVPLYVGDVRVPHSWDIRADWREQVPRCSAVMTEGYEVLERFPAWFYNLPPADAGRQPTPADRPPNVTTSLSLDGYLYAARPGVLRVLVGEDVQVSVQADDQVIADSDVSGGVTLDAGLHRVSIRGDLVRSHWSLTPLWNGGDLWRETPATISPPSGLDLWARPWGRAVPPLMIAGLVLLAVRSIAHRARSVWVLGYAVGLSSIFAAVSWSGREALMRAAPLLLLASVLVPLPRRVQNLFGISLLVGLPFLSMFVALGAPQAGIFTWYSGGDDWWMFQRYAYRIFMQGYWLEGGQPTFWFQPLYRWIAGALHMVFGDASIGELFWDAGCALAGAVFAFHVTRVFAGFRWGVVAAVTTLAVFTLGPMWYLFGRGLSEITSAGLLYGAALCALRGRNGRWPAIVLAGSLATLAFYARLNNLPIALAVATFAFPVREPVASLRNPAVLWTRASHTVVAGVLGAVCIGIYLFSWRTWYYTHVFDMLWGTSTKVNAVAPAGENLLFAVASSVMMLLTLNDPPRFDVRALPVLAGFAAAVLGVTGVGRFARLPLGLVVFAFAGVSSALVVRGSTYPGRFSVHLIPVTVALAVCALSLVLDGASGSVSTNLVRTRVGRSSIDAPSKPSRVS